MSSEGPLLFSAFLLLRKGSLSVLLQLGTSPSFGVWTPHRADAMSGGSSSEPAPPTVKRRTISATALGSPHVMETGQPGKHWDHAEQRAWEHNLQSKALFFSAGEELKIIWLASSLASTQKQLQVCSLLGGGFPAVPRLPGRVHGSQSPGQTDLVKSQHKGRTVPKRLQSLWLRRMPLEFGNPNTRILI